MIRPFFKITAWKKASQQNAFDDLRIITAEPTAAPEPSGVLMLGMGLLTLMVFNLKRLIA